MTQCTDRLEAIKTLIQLECMPDFVKFMSSTAQSVKDITASSKTDDEKVMAIWNSLKKNHMAGEDDLPAYSHSNG